MKELDASLKLVDKVIDLAPTTGTVHLAKAAWLQLTALFSEGGIVNINGRVVTPTFDRGMVVSGTYRGIKLLREPS